MVRLSWPVLKLRLARILLNKKRINIIELQDIKLSGRTLIDKKLIPVHKLDSHKWKILTDHYLLDELNCLGSGWISILNRESRSRIRPQLAAEEPDWNRIHKNGYHLPIVEARKAISEVLSQPGQDVKHSWEFARMHHLPQLAIATELFPEKEHEILSKVRFHLISFIDQCPVGQGVHWSSPMEVAIRLSNILICLDLVPEIREDLITKYCIAHWEYILTHLEHKEGLSNNHYLANLMGLLVFGVYFKGPEVERASDFALGELQIELRKQFFSDGMNFEYSSYYHRLSTEIGIISLLAAIKSGRKPGVDSFHIISKALGVVQLLTKPDYSMPRFGDNDSGRILDLDPVIRPVDLQVFPEDCSFLTFDHRRSSIYHQFYSSVLQKLFITPIPTALTMQYPIPRLRYEHVWELNHETTDISSLEVTHLEESGLVIFKSPRYYLAVNFMANPRGHRYRGHMHNDKGSFELNVCGRDIILDPGTLSYTASVKERSMYRHTQAHHVAYTGMEQNRSLSSPLGSFHACLDVTTKLLKLSESGLVLLITYRGVINVREFRIMSDKLIVTDQCNHNFVVNKQPIPKPAIGYGRLQ